MISVIIPAYNEEKVITATLRELIPGVENGELEIIVVCNGCTDNTASVVRSFAPMVQCIETTVASKSNALNRGDELATGFPRFYQDADVILPLDAIRLTSLPLQAESILAAAPQMRMDFQGASWVVRAYYEIWQQLPYVREGMIGTGVYALSEKGRKRFGNFPEVIADDGFIRRLFQSQERTVIDSCFVRVSAPKNLNGLLKIKTRSRLGGYELLKKFPELIGNEEKSYANALLHILGNVYLWPKAPVYLLVNILARIRAKKHAREHGFIGWERDNSSREGRR